VAREVEVHRGIPEAQMCHLCAHRVQLFHICKTLKDLGLPKYSYNYFLWAEEIVPKTFLILNIVSFTLGKQLL